MVPRNSIICKIKNERCDLGFHRNLSLQCACGNSTERTINRGVIWRHPGHMINSSVEHLPERCIGGRSGRHVFVLVSSNPTVVTNVKPMLAVGADDVAEKSPWRDREARAPCSRPYVRRKPGRGFSRILARN